MLENDEMKEAKDSFVEAQRQKTPEGMLRCIAIGLNQLCAAIEREFDVIRRFTGKG